MIPMEGTMHSQWILTLGLDFRLDNLSFFRHGVLRYQEKTNKCE